MCVMTAITFPSLLGILQGKKEIFFRDVLNEFIEIEVKSNQKKTQKKIANEFINNNNNIQNKKQQGKEILILWFLWFNINLMQAIFFDNCSFSRSWMTAKNRKCLHIQMFSVIFFFSFFIRMFNGDESARDALKTRSLGNS